MSKLPDIIHCNYTPIKSSFSTLTTHEDVMKYDKKTDERFVIDLEAQIKEKKMNLNAKSFVKSIEKYNKATSRVSDKIQPIPAKKQFLVEKNNSIQHEKRNDMVDSAHDQPEAQSLIDSLRKINDGISKLTEEIKNEKFEIRMEEAKRWELVSQVMDVRRKQNDKSAPASARRDRVKLNTAKINAVSKLLKSGSSLSKSGKRNLLSPKLPSI